MQEVGRAKMPRGNGEQTSHQRICGLLGAVMSGLWLGVFYGWTRNSGDVYQSDFTNCVVLATASFVASAVAIIWTKSRVPISKWVLVAVLGSLISFVLIVLIPNVKHAWEFSEHPSLLRFLLDFFPGQMLGLIVSVAIDTVVVLPLMAMFHYLPRMLGFPRKSAPREINGQSLR
jgi:hypothetical protein